MKDNWRLRAACIGEAPEDFFTDTKMDYCKEICNRCPVREECLTENIGEQYGVFGGLNRKERRKLWREWNSTGEKIVPLPITSHSDEDRRQAIKLYKNDMGYEAVANHMGIHWTTIRRWVADAGILRSSKEALALSMRQQAHKAAVRREYIQFHAAQGRPIKEIAEEVGLSVSHTYKLSKEG